MNCETVKKLITAQLSGELNEAESSELKVHLGECEECRKEFFELRSAYMLAEEVFAKSVSADSSLSASSLETLHTALVSPERESGASLAKEHSRRIFFRCAALFAVVFVAALGAFAVYLADSHRRVDELGCITKAVAGLPVYESANEVTLDKVDVDGLSAVKEKTRADKPDSAFTSAAELDDESFEADGSARVFECGVADSASGSVTGGMDKAEIRESKKKLAVDEQRGGRVASSKAISPVASPPPVMGEKNSSAFAEADTVKSSVADGRDAELNRAKTEEACVSVGGTVIMSARENMNSLPVQPTQMVLRSSNISNSASNDLSRMMRADKLDFNNGVTAPPDDVLYSYSALLVKSPFRANTYVVYARAVPNEKKIGRDQVYLRIDSNVSMMSNCNTLRQADVSYAESLLFELPSDSSLSRDELIAGVSVGLVDKAPLSSYKVTRANLIEDFSKAPAPLRLVTVAHAAVDPELVLDSKIRSRMIEELEKLLANEYANDVNVMRLKIILQKFK